MSDSMLNHWTPYSQPDLTGFGPPGDVRLLILLKKHLAGRRFATDADVKQAVTSWQQTLDINFFYAGIQAVVSWWWDA
jgi:hypothetical protein